MFLAAAKLGTNVLADDGDSPEQNQAPSAAPTGTPPAMPGVAAGQMAAPGGSPSPGVLPPQGAAVPMQVRAAGEHAAGMDIMRGVLKAMREALAKLGTTKEAATVAEMLEKGYKVFSNPNAGKDDTVDPHFRIAQAIAQNRQAGRGGPPGAPQPPMGGAPGMPPQMAMPPRGPIPAAGGPPQ